MTSSDTSSKATGAWSLPGLSDLRSVTAGDPAIRIAVLDGPVDLSHPCFHGGDLQQTSSVSTPPAMPAAEPSIIPSSASHGTHVSSILFGQQDTGEPRGIAPDCRGLLIPVYAQSEQGDLIPCSQRDLAQGIELAIAHGAQVINVSGGQLTRNGEADPFLIEAVRRCAEANVLLISAVGNEGCQCLHVPASLPTALAVGAMDARGLPLAFSNWGRPLAEQGVLAPGESIVGAEPGGGISPRTGTSFATPVVSGVVALLLALQRRAGQEMNPGAIRRAILEGAVPCDPAEVTECARMLTGRLDIARTLESLDLARHLEPQEHPGGAVSPARARAAVATTLSGTTAIRPAQEMGGRQVFALGTLGYDFGNDIRFDYFAQQLGSRAEASDPISIAQHLLQDEEQLAQGQALIWTLSLETTPIYAIRPLGGFGPLLHRRLARCLAEQASGQTERISIAGELSGTIKLYNGSVVPVVTPVLRGLFNWSNRGLVESLVDAASAAPGDPAWAHRVDRFLTRVYHEFLNPGLRTEDRALNYAATNAFQLREVFEDALSADLELEQIAVERSPICRPRSDCWDVALRFFDPRRLHQRARKVYRYTIDVSDVVPVAVGSMRSWYIYSSN